MSPLDRATDDKPSPLPNPAATGAAHPEVREER
jgi:hypothetical protein